MRTFIAATVLALVFLPLRAQTDPGWPREVDSGGRHYTIYQPQVDRWKDDRLDARAVVTVTEPGAATQPAYGIVALSARTSVDKVTRTVTLEDPKAESAVFPAASGRQSELLGAIRASLPDWPRVISLDRLLADLAITQSETAAESVPLKSDVPRIIFSTTPAVLVLIDGDPVLRRVQGTRYTRVINTPALLVFDSGANRYYLDGQTFWMTAASLNGPWSVAPAPPADLDSLRNQVDQTEEKEPGAPAPGPSPAQGGVAPSVYVSTVPAELLQTDGQPQYAPIAGTKLSYVTNTESDLFLDVGSQSYFVLLSGRWFQAKSLNGPWSWVAGQQLPAEFSRIPLNSPKSGVLASVPETPQAREAIIANQIPQTATVKRNEARLDVRYDGPPQFRAISGTPMQYAVNTDTDVIYAEGRYYACRDAVWFVADSPEGPWSVADRIPAVIYTIPPSSPLFHDRYVYVYRSTPEYVYVGYTPGYLGAYIWDGVVVFGTGWIYPPWIGDIYVGWPWTWGFGFRFGYWGVGWFWRPIHRLWWYRNPPHLHRIYTEHWNPRWNPGDRQVFRHNANVYNRLPERAVVRGVVRPSPAPGRVPGARAPRGDLYADHDGRVYDRRRDGWYRQDGSGQWRRAPATPRLEQQRQSRELGNARQGEFQRRGPSPGVPATRAPAAESRKPAPGTRAPAPAARAPRSEGAKSPRR